MLVPGLAGGDQWHFEPAAGPPNKLVWQTELGLSYYLFQSRDLVDWSAVPAFPQAGTGGPLEHAFTAESRGFFKIIAGPPARDGFVLIPAGSFQMGDQANPPVGYGEQPVHSVYVSGFYLAQYEVTKALWDEVRAWAVLPANGYIGLAAGAGKAPDHPVQSISWYDMVKWCNARSEKEGLTPCYTTNGTTYKTGSGVTPLCDWSASGYRLPSEAEWEKAARGSLKARNFPWGNKISHAQANYYADPSYPDDVNPTEGHHPTYQTGALPYTAPVGSLGANWFGLYDMAGNVLECCWDRHGDYAAGAQTDPHGPSSGPLKVVRGGSWFDDAWYCRVAFRNGRSPTVADAYCGFRPARSVLP
jgi:formylglycine-generating enzyme required for sulfatase activity